MLAPAHALSQGPRLRLGDLLVKKGLLSAAQLEKALKTQGHTGERLGEILVKSGFLPELDVSRALAEHLGLSFSASLEAEPEALACLQPAAARRLCLVPISINLGVGVLRVATADPMNLPVLEEAERLSGRKIERVVVTRRILERSLDRYYGSWMASSPTASTGGSATMASTEAPAVVLAQTIFRRALDDRASDIHLEPGENDFTVRYRIDGVLLKTLTLSKELLPPLISHLKITASMDIAEKRLPQDGHFALDAAETNGHCVDVRVSTLPTVNGEKMILRLLDQGALRRINELGFTLEALETYRRFIHAPFGMVLVTGPTGSGKSTTLMASLLELDRDNMNIVTVEDPVEYLIPGIAQSQVNAKAGLTFARTLRSILRQDPDVIMVGEIRDHETVEIAVRAALTGHQVLSTLHASNAPSVPGRLVEMGVEPYLVASSLLGIVSQRLVRHLCQCRTSRYLPEDDPLLLALGAPPGTYWFPKGCSRCNGTGYLGRVPLWEVLTFTPSLRRLCLEKADAQTVQSQAEKEGFRPLRLDGLEKAKGGLTSLEEIRKATFYLGS